MRISKKILSFILVTALLFFSFYFFYMRPRHVVPILMYHSVDNRDSTLCVTEENFLRQMTFLHENGYSVISLDDLVHGIEKKARFAPKTLVITFDDGFKDNYTNAFPILERYNMPAIIFLITSYMNTHEGYIKWDQARLMMEKDIDFGAHTRHGVYLPEVESQERLWEEIAGCKKDIELKIGKEVRYFCYTVGGFNERVKEIVKKADYKGACTTNRGLDRSNRDVYELNRIKITNSDMNKPFHFRAKLSGYYNLFRRLKAGN